jgi:hypothetical protein
VVALVGVTAVAAAPAGRRLRSAAAVAASFAVFLVGAWLALGQGLGALGPFLRTSVEIVRGYAEYAYSEEPGREWEYYAAALAALVLAVLVHRAGGALRPLPRAAVWLVVGLYAFGWFKQGFVRHDAHSIDFFLAVFLAGVALLVPRPPGAGRLLPLVCLAALLVGYLAVARPVPWEFQRRDGGWELLRAHLDSVRDADAVIAERRAALRTAEALDGPSLDLVRGRSVHVFPSEAAVAWAYPELRWRPAPVFQGYVAYTDALDRLNADALAAPDGPERILRTTDYSPWEDPRAVREVLCRFRELRAGERWQVLARAPSRCGPLESLGRVRVGRDGDVPIPEPAQGEAVLVAIHGAEPGLLERLRSLLYKPYSRDVLLDGERSVRFATGLAGVPTVVRVAGDVDFGGDFAMDLGATRMAPRITSGGVLAMGRTLPRALELEFFRMPLTEPARTS